MKKALISPNEICYGNAEKTQSGHRIAQVCDSEFAVANPLYWIDVADDTNTRKYYDPNDQQVKDIYVPTEVEPLPELTEEELANMD